MRRESDLKESNIRILFWVSLPSTLSYCSAFGIRFDFLDFLLTRFGSAMASALADQLGNTKISDEASDSAWKDKIKLPTKDARPQTEVDRTSRNEKRALK